MALHVRFPYETGATLGFSVERLADGLFLDFGDSRFKPKNQVSKLIELLPENLPLFSGLYTASIEAKPLDQFIDCGYAIPIHVITKANVVVDVQYTCLFDGDDQPQSMSKITTEILKTAGTLTV